MDCSLLVSSVHGILQAKILEWVAISFYKRVSRSVVSDSFNYTRVTGGKMEALTQKCSHFPSKVKQRWKFFWFREEGMRGDS